MIYLDNAATSFYRPETVARAVAEAINTMGNCSRGTYETALTSARTVYETRDLLSGLFHGDGPEQVAFTANSTESLNTAIQGLFSEGDHVITTVLEHNSVLRPLYLMEKRGISLTILPCDEQGVLCYDRLEESIRPETKAVVCTHASNLTGNRMDLDRIGEICLRHGIRLVVDASQTAGVLPIDMKRMHIDVLCFTGHKGLLGPQGTGGICVGDGIHIRPLKTGGSGVHTYLKEHPRDMPTALEAGTLNGHGIAGLHAALGFIKETGVEIIHRREAELMRRFYDGVVQIPGVRVYGDFTSDERAAIVALNIGDYDSSEVSDELAVTYGISTRPGAHCAPLMHESFKTVEQGMVRFSFSYFNTEEEIDAGIQAVRELAAEE